MARDGEFDRLREEHTPRAVAERLKRRSGTSYLRDFIYGAIDGTVTTFAVVSGVAGARLGAGIIVVLGAANLLADGFSMAVGNFLGLRAEWQQRDQTRRREREHIRCVPEGEREEIRQIFRAKGFSGDDLERAVDIITAEEERWVETMLRDEYGLAGVPPHPGRAAATTFFAFVAIGFIPLLPFVWNVAGLPAWGQPFLWSSILTGVAFFVIGLCKGLVVAAGWVRSGLETLAVGGVAAALAYAIGAALRGVAG